MRAPRFEVYERNDGQFDWRLKSGNADVVATSHGQGFRDPTDTVRSIGDTVRVVEAMLDAITAGELDGIPIVALAPGELGMTPGEETGDDAGDDEGQGDTEEAQADDEELGEGFAGAADAAERLNDELRKDRE